MLLQEDDVVPPTVPESTPEGVPERKKKSRQPKKRPAAAVDKSDKLESENEPVRKKPSKKDAAAHTVPESHGPAPSDEDTSPTMKKPSAKAKGKSKSEKSRKTSEEALTFHNPSWHKNCNNWCLKSSRGHIMSVP